jgi:hypothetical protein
LGNAQRLFPSLWEILKGYRKAAGKCPSTHCQLIEEKAESPVAMGKNVAISFHFFGSTAFLFIFMKNTRLF